MIYHVVESKKKITFAKQRKNRMIISLHQHPGPVLESTPLKGNPNGFFSVTKSPPVFPKQKSTKVTSVADPPAVCRCSCAEKYQGFEEIHVSLGYS